MCVHNFEAQFQTENQSKPTIMTTCNISVITPVKNGIRYLDECVQSVPANVEHLFVDGGSTDGTLEALEGYSKIKPSLRYVTGKDRNAGDAWVKGLRMATGDILGWLGVDDSYTPAAIQTVLKFFNEHPIAMIAYGSCNYVDDSGKVIKTVIPKEFDTAKARNGQCSIPCTSVFFRREILDTVKPEIIAEQDSELGFWIAISRKHKLYRIDAVLSNFRIHDTKDRKDGFYIYAKTVYEAGKNQGLSPLSLGSLRYYVAWLLKPLSFVIDPIFLAVVRR